MFSMRINHIAKCCCTLLFLVFTLPVGATQQTAFASPEREVALKLLQEKQYAEAVKAWRRFLSDANNKKDAEAWMYFGTALYRNKELDAARDAFKQSVKLNPKSEASRSVYAVVLYNLKKYLDAEKEVKEVLKLNANNTDILYLQSRLRYNRGEYEKALVDLDQILKLDAQFGSAYLLKSQIIIEQLYANGEKLKTDFPLKWKATFLESAQYLEQYLQRNPSAEEANFWSERVNALRFYGGADSSFMCEKYSATLHPEILYQEKAPYTDEARNLGIQGIIRLRGIFDVDGQIKHIMPMNFLGAGLTYEAIKAMKKIRFRPAVKDGKPVCMSLIVEFSFELR